MSTQPIAVPDAFEAGLLFAAELMCVWCRAREGSSFDPAPRLVRGEWEHAQRSGGDTRACRADEIHAYLRGRA